MPLNFPLESKSESMQTTPFSVVSAKRNKSWDCTHLLAHQIKFYVTKQITLIHIHNTNTYITSNFDILSRISFLSFFFRNQSFQGIHPKNCTNIAKRIFAIFASYLLFLNANISRQQLCFVSKQLMYHCHLAIRN
jgi:hypothetical protein